MKSYYPKRFAHRGLCQHAPENTLGAFIAAVYCGCEGIELDIRMSKDGEIMVVHDGTLNRLSFGKEPRKICDLTKDEIMSVDIPYGGNCLPHNPPVPYSEDAGSRGDYTEEERIALRDFDPRVTHIMTFEMFDSWFEKIERDITVEIEFCCGGLAKRMAELLAKSKNCSRYICFSGDVSTVEEMQKEFHDENGKCKFEGLRFGANFRRLTDDKKELIEKLDFYEIGLNDQWYTPEDVQYLADRGIKTFSNLGDYPEYWQSINNELKIEAFKTNYAEAYAEWADENV